MISIHNGDALRVLKSFESGSVACCVTSPPYWGLRDYGTAGQIGLEKTPGEYVGRLVDVFQEVRRVLCDDGTLWVNLGDSYAGSWRNQGRQQTRDRQRPVNGPMMQIVDDGRYCSSGSNTGKCPPGLKPKDLVGIPWRVAFALQSEGWYLRSDIIWHKPNPMPESVADRPTKSHEYLFLLSKSTRYYFDADAVREDAESRPQKRLTSTSNQPKGPGRAEAGVQNPTCQGGTGGGRNIRSVWTIPTRPYTGAHFATFPPKLVEPCIKAGCPEGGTVLDPFGGAGTTGLVADRLGRHAILIEINGEYSQMAEDRIAGDSPLFASVKQESGK